VLLLLLLLLLAGGALGGEASGWGILGLALWGMNFGCVVGASAKALGLAFCRGGPGGGALGDLDRVPIAGDDGDGEAEKIPIFEVVNGY